MKVRYSLMKPWSFPFGWLNPPGRPPPERFISWGFMCIQAPLLVKTFIVISAICEGLLVISVSRAIITAQSLCMCPITTTRQLVCRQVSVFCANCRRSRQSACNQSNRNEAFSVQSLLQILPSNSHQPPGTNRKRCQGEEPLKGEFKALLHRRHTWKLCSYFIYLLRIICSEVVRLFKANFTVKWIVS